MRGTVPLLDGRVKRQQPRKTSRLLLAVLIILIVILGGIYELTNKSLRGKNKNEKGIDVANMVGGELELMEKFSFEDKAKQTSYEMASLHTKAQLEEALGICMQTLQEEQQKFEAITARVEECEEAMQSGESSGMEGLEEGLVEDEEIMPGMKRQTRNRHRNERKSVDFMIGVQTSFQNNVRAKYDERREAIRQTWFSKKEPMQKALRQAKIVVKFVVGRYGDASMDALVDAEIEAHGDIMRLEVEEGYQKLTFKTRAFFETALELYDAKYYMKIDDDVYLKINRLPSALIQWDGIGADYIGCMKTGDIQRDPAFKWYEPQHAVLGDASYFAHTWGSLYILSQKAVEGMTSIDAYMLRHLANEDVTVGLWMLALDMTHYDDRRLCMKKCTEDTLAVFDMPYPGLVPAETRMYEVHEEPKCAADHGDFESQTSIGYSIIKFDEP